MLPNGVCVLPDEEIEDSTVDKCLDYCKNGSCTVINNAPSCSCPEGYLGLTCDLVLESAKTSNNESITDLFSPSESIIDMTKPEVIIQIQAITIIVDQAPSVINTTITEETKDTIFKSTNRTITSITKTVRDQKERKKRTKPNRHYNKLLALSIKLELAFLLRSITIGRNLEGSTNNLEELIKQAHELNMVNANATQIDAPEQYYFDPYTNLITFQRYRATKDGKKQYLIGSQKINTPSISFDNVDDITDDFIVAQTTYGSNIQKSIRKRKPIRLS